MLEATGAGLGWMNIKMLGMQRMGGMWKRDFLMCELPVAAGCAHPAVALSASRHEPVLSGQRLLLFEALQGIKSYWFD